MGHVPEKRRPIIGEFYMVTGEDPYHYALVVRGEVEKSLLTFYSALAFGVDKITWGAVERFALYDQRFAPYYINSSGGMRICGMIRRTLLLEKDSELHLLAGVPRRWLEAGKMIEVRDAVTYFGSMDLKVQSEVDKGRVLAELNLRYARPERLRSIVMRIPHPTRQRMSGVAVNGQQRQDFDPELGTIRLTPADNRYQIIAWFN